MSNRDKNDDLESYLDEGEGTHVEFKAHLPSSVRVARALVAFANTRGGTLVVGVHDDQRAHVVALHEACGLGDGIAVSHGQHRTSGLGF